jgi:hypothetical protein
LRKQKEEEAMRTIIISVITIIALLLGCRKDDLLVNPQSESNGIIPLAVGNQWIYSLNAYDTTGNIKISTSSTYQVMGDSVNSGVRWFRISNFYCTNKNLGLFSSDGLLALKYPTFVPDSFYVNATVGYIHVISIDTMITIPLGTYHCYAYASDQPISPGMTGSSYEVMYVSPKVGPIKAEIYASPQTNKKQYLYATTELYSLTLH